jgi:small subunit ribosomal protein S6
MRHYETIFIVNPELVEDNLKEVITKFKDLIERLKGIIVNVQEWGTQKMAYAVRKFDKGSYVLVEYCGNPGLTAEFERGLKLDDRILLFQTVKLADSVDPQELLRKKEEEEAKKARPAADAPVVEKEAKKEQPAADAPVVEKEAKKEQPAADAPVVEKETAPEQETASEADEKQMNEEVKNGD